MGIFYNGQTSVFTLDTDNSTYQLRVGRYGVLEHLYYGPRIYDTETDYLIRFYGRGFSGNPDEAGNDTTLSLIHI